MMMIVKFDKQKRFNLTNRINYNLSELLPVLFTMLALAATSTHIYQIPTIENDFLWVQLNMTHILVRKKYILQWWRHKKARTRYCKMSYNVAF
jgi:hypothetical protein